MTDNKTSHTDEGLQDNEQIEQAILALQQQPSQEMLAHALTVLRRRGRARGRHPLYYRPAQVTGPLHRASVLCL